MKFFSYLWCLLWVTCTNGTPTPSKTCSSKPQGKAFGIPGTSGIAGKHMKPLLVRGGELHSPKSSDDVDALILKAASNDQLTVIDFTASWCGPCKLIAPMFKELSEELPEVMFVKVDVDEDPETAAKYSVSAMPTFVFVKRGEVVDRLMGANGPRLRELIREQM